MLKKIKSESGFSLIEISIVVAIAGVLAAMSIYSFRGETSTFGADKALLRDTLVRARDMARGRVNCVLVRVDTTHHGGLPAWRGQRLRAPRGLITCFTPCAVFNGRAILRV